ncbi:hypothetical protein B0H34DRAFT_272383 [Crassisporium funariophilum]|nr:hypothetical protein B0H34DRAFT_272383 [Crassisporium funariophilum]
MNLSIKATPNNLIHRQIDKGKEKVKYDDSTTIVCPSCGEDVRVGSAGPAGLAQHEGKGPCRKNQAKRKQQKKTRTLFDVGLKKTNNVLGRLIGAPAAASSPSRNKDPAPITVFCDSHKTGLCVNETVSGGQDRRGCQRGWELITELKEAEKRLDLKIAVGKDITKSWKLL